MTTFNIYKWKGIYTNDKNGMNEWLLDNIDMNEYSFYLAKYKYPEELPSRDFMVKNFVSGLINELDSYKNNYNKKLSSYSFGHFIITKFNVECLWLIKNVDVYEKKEYIGTKASSKFQINNCPNCKSECLECSPNEPVFETIKMEYNCLNLLLDNSTNELSAFTHFTFEKVEDVNVITQYYNNNVSDFITTFDFK